MNLCDLLSSLFFDNVDVENFFSGDEGVVKLKMRSEEEKKQLAGERSNKNRSHRMK